MPESYGVTETPLSQDKLLSGDHPRVELPVTIASGCGELSRGTLLGRRLSNGKYAPITPGTTYEDQDIGDGTGSQYTFSGTLPNPGVKPGSLVIRALISDTEYETFTDQGDGTLKSDATPTPGAGTIKYASGEYSVTFKTAPKSEKDILATYIGSLTAHTGEDIETDADGSQKEWRKFLSYTKVIERTVRIYTNEDPAKVLRDDGHGNLVGTDGRGSINYETGEIEIEFDDAPELHSTIDADYCSTDGTHICRAILARDIDATSEDVNTITYVHGVFNPEGVVWPTGTSDTQKQEIARDCQERGIYFKFSL
ncbi:hypothetical protein CEE36_08400 [candidate division TA06 bacterium B3_TA06]|uniref:Uncharacterized protein n=1 Tax=candidate division TA06 bacterium B3_TA06 TaxID=2012487 RepID=A0A532V288_UNCT6|nr:MAG: hypothetical protein CEE36_08400 [candidate division TA06 bacterium B3_TA06]